MLLPLSKHSNKIFVPNTSDIKKFELFEFMPEFEHDDFYISEFGFDRYGYNVKIIYRLTDDRVNACPHRG